MVFTLLILTVFLSAAALDYSWSRWTDAVRLRQRIVAANWSVAIGALGLIGFLSIGKYSTWLAIPEIIGWWFGTYLAVRPDGKSDHRNS